MKVTFIQGLSGKFLDCVCIICMLYNKIYTDEQINVLCEIVEKNRVAK